MVAPIALTCLVLAGTVSAQFAAWPNPSHSTDKTIEKTINVTRAQPYDGKGVRHIAGKGLGDGSHTEGQLPVFIIEEGATIRNVVIGSPAADGIHCQGSCTIENVWWEDVGEDAATFNAAGNGSARYNVIGGGAKHAADKVFQHNGGGVATIKNFQVEDWGKLWRSCGNCGCNYKRTVVIDTIRAKGPGANLAGANEIVQLSGKLNFVCETYLDNGKGTKPTNRGAYKVGQDGDGKVCNYKKADVKTV
ncbi:pectate lyase [Aphelenchoides avenae]|nr:pectate lyase [Aphelenchus avenae]